MAFADSGNRMGFALALLTSPLVLLGLAVFGLSAIVWLFVLSKIAFSHAYPFVALGIVVTVAAGGSCSESRFPRSRSLASR